MDSATRSSTSIFKNRTHEPEPLVIYSQSMYLQAGLVHNNCKLQDISILFSYSACSTVKGNGQNRTSAEMSSLDISVERLPIIRLPGLNTYVLIFFIFGLGLEMVMQRRGQDVKTSLS